LSDSGGEQHAGGIFGAEKWSLVGSHKKPLKDYFEKERELWRLLSGPTQDWSAQICPDATLNDLDPAAIAFARQQSNT
jgi:ATP-dependent DNA helicase RecG